MRADCNVLQNIPFADLYFTFSITSLAPVSAAFYTGGIYDAVILNQRGSDVTVDIGTDIPFARWQIHELPVDFSIDPKLRCRPEHVGQYLQHSSRDGKYIYNVTTTSLVMHSVVLFVNEELVTCGSIFPNGLPEFPATLKFKIGVFGRMYIIKWPLSGECINYE